MSLDHNISESPSRDDDWAIIASVGNVQFVCECDSHECQDPDCYEDASIVVCVPPNPWPILVCKRHAKPVIAEAPRYASNIIKRGVS